MPELAEIVRIFRTEYYQKYGSRMLPSHRKAIEDIINCRTPVLGGRAYECSDCNEWHYSYHSCNNRHCPKCQNDLITTWIAEQQKLLLPVPYFLVTFTLPHTLNSCARSHQKSIYHILFLASSYALKKIARDTRFLGAEVGMLGVLQTWARDLSYHVHIHYLVPCGGISFDKQHWIVPKYTNFLVHVKPLSRLFRGKFTAEWKKAGFPEELLHTVFKQDWVVHIQPTGSGQEVIKYLAPYLYRTALSNNRITKLQGRTVTFRYQDRDAHRWKYIKLDAIEFMSRFLQHVLPKGFVKVRSFGFLAPNQRHLLRRVQTILLKQFPQAFQGEPPLTQSKLKEYRCRKCGGILLFRHELPKRERSPPDDTYEQLSVYPYFLLPA